MRYETPEQRRKREAEEQRRRNRNSGYTPSQTTYVDDYTPSYNSDSSYDSCDSSSPSCD
ncbi:hypothetical protein [Citrobacter phage Ci1]|nr:hypothetical protein [Citrobacter phage Ci1]